MDNETARALDSDYFEVQRAAHFYSYDTDDEAREHIIDEWRDEFGVEWVLGWV